MRKWLNCTSPGLGFAGQFLEKKTLNHILDSLMATETIVVSMIKISLGYRFLRSRQKFLPANAFHGFVLLSGLLDEFLVLVITHMDRLFPLIKLVTARL